MSREGAESSDRKGQCGDREGVEGEMKVAMLKDEESKDPGAKNDVPESSGCGDPLQFSCPLPSIMYWGARSL